MDEATLGESSKTLSRPILLACIATDVLHEIDHQTFGFACEDHTFEARCILANLEFAADRRRDIGEHESTAFERFLLRREQRS